MSADTLGSALALSHRELHLHSNRTSPILVTLLIFFYLGLFRDSRKSSSTGSYDEEGRNVGGDSSVVVRLEMNT